MSTMALAAEEATALWDRDQFLAELRAVGRER